MTATREPHASPRTRLLRAVWCAAIAWLFASSWASVAHAQTTLTWGISGSAATGNWTSSGTNWWNGTTNVAWADNSIAWIGGTTQNTITVSGFTPAVSGITFSPTTNQTISGGAIALASATTPITSLNASNTINNQLTGIGTGMVTRGGITFTGSNSYTGPTVVTGGMTLSGANAAIANSSSLTITGNSIFILNLASLNLNRLGDSMPVNMEGATFRNGGSSPSNWSETTGSLKVNAGSNNIWTVRAGSGTTSTLTFASLERSSGATMQFGSNGGYAGLGVDSRNRILFTTTPTLSNGIIGGWAIHSDTAGFNWATYDATNGVQALSTYQTGTESSWTSADNVRLTGTQTLSANRSINSLLMSNTATAVRLGIPSGGTLTVGSGGVLLTGNNTNAFVIGTSGGGSITAGGSGPADLMLYNTTTAQADFYPSVVDNGSANGAVSVVKNGEGYIFWWTQGEYSGDTVINQGRLIPRGNNLIPSGSGKGNVVVRTAGTFDLYGTNQAVNGLSGDGIVTLLSNGTSTLTVGANDASSNFSGSLNNGNTLRILALTKTGTGSLSLTGSSTFTGTTAVQNGIVRFNSVASSTTAQALGGGSVVTLGLAATSSGEIDYTGSTGTFDKNVFALGSGRNRIRNSGGGTLTLSGTLTKNGTILELAQGSFTVSGQITGASANSDLYVNGASVTLTNTNNDYNGPTYVYGGGTLTLGASNVIPAGSALLLGGAGSDTGTGTLVTSTFTDTIASLTSSAAGSTLDMTINGAAAGGLTTSGNVSFGAGTDTLALTMTSPSAGRYQLLTYQGTLSGTFDTVSGLNSNYTIAYGTGSNSSIDAQMKASLGAVTPTVVNPTIIVGGTAGLTYTVANTTPTGGASLSFTSTGGPGVVGSSNGLAAAGQTSTSISGLGYVGSGVGLGQAGSFTVTDPNAIVTTGTGSFTVDVLNHSQASFAATDTATKTLDFGSYDQGAWSGGNGTLGFSIFNMASGGFSDAQTADLDLYEWVFTSGNDVFSTGLSAFTNLAAGSSNPFSATVASPGSLAAGSYSGTYTLRFRDENLPGGATTRDLTLTMNVIVVPEPGALALAGIGIAAAAWAARRRK